MGILDFLNPAAPQQGGGLLNFMEDPRQMGMLGLASGLLQASGPSTQRIGIGQALGQGLQGAAGLASAAQRTQLQNAQMKKLMADQAEAQRQRAAWEATLSGLESGATGAPGGMGKDQVAMLRSLGPQAGGQLLAGRMFKDNTPIIMKPGDVGIDPVTRQPIPGMVGGPPQPKIGDVRKYHKGDQEITEHWTGDNKWELLGTGPRWNPQEKPLFGAGTEGSSLGIINALNEKMKAGTALPHERQLYALAYNHYTQPKMQMSADGTVVSVTPQLPENMFDPRGAHNRPPPSAGQAGPPSSPASDATQIADQNVQNIAPGVQRIGDPKATKLTMEESAKAAGIAQAQKDLQIATANLFRQDGSLNTGLLLQAQRYGPVEGAPMTPGRDMRQQFQRAIEVWLRANTGAAAPEQEVARYLNMYFPSPLDSPDAARAKVGALQNIMGATMGEFAAGRPQFQGRAGASQSMKQRYGLD